MGFFSDWVLTILRCTKSFILVKLVMNFIEDICMCLFHVKKPRNDSFILQLLNIG